MTLAENLQTARKEKGLTQEELAEEIGITQKAISMFERGIKIPSVSVLAQTADALNCTTDWLLGREEVKQ